MRTKNTIKKNLTRLKLNVHRMLENDGMADQRLASGQLELLPLGDPIMSFVLCVDGPDGRVLAGVVPKALRERVETVYERCSSWSVNLFSPHAVASEQDLWIELVAVKSER